MKVYEIDNVRNIKWYHRILLLFYKKYITKDDNLKIVYKVMQGKIFILEEMSHLEDCDKALKQSEIEELLY